MFSLLDLPQSDAHFILNVLLDASIKGLVVLVFAGVAALALRKATAALRHLVWSLALGSLLCLPVLSAALPQWRIAILPGASELQPGAIGALGEDIAVPAADFLEASAVPGPVETAEAARADLPVPEDAADAGEAAAGPGTVLPARHLNWRVMLLAGWTAGALIVGLPLMIGMIIIVKRSRNAAPAAGAPAERLDALRRRIGIRRPVSLLYAPGAEVPATWGVFRPVILAPADMAGWSDQRCRVVLLHELAHIRRLDWLTLLMGRIVRIVYWFHPLVWLAVRMQRIEAERACDDAVLSAGLKPSDYARQLLDIVATFRRPGCSSLAAVAMARRSSLEGRVLSILDPARRRGHVTRVGVICTVAAMACLASTISTMQVGSTAALAGERAPRGGTGDPELLLQILQARKTNLEKIQTVSGVADVDDRTYATINPAPDAQAGYTKVSTITYALDDTAGARRSKVDQKKVHYPSRPGPANEAMQDHPIVQDQMVTDDGAFRFDTDHQGKLMRQLVISPWEDSSRLNELFDPRAYLEQPIPHERMESSIRSLYRTLKSGTLPPESEAAIERTGSTITITAGFRPHYMVRYVFDLDQGGNLKSYERSADGSTEARVQMTYEQHEGVWFPATYESITKLPSDPRPKERHQKIVLRDTVINSTIPASEFTPVAMGLRKGDFITDHRRGAPSKFYRYDGKILPVPPDPHPAAPLPADDWQRYCVQFAETYKLDDAQKAQAAAMCREAFKRRQEYMASHDIPAGGTKGFAEWQKPINEMFEQLKARLLTIPTEAQRKVVEAGVERADSWTRYVEWLIVTYQFDEGQQQTARSILKELKDRAREYHASHKAEYDALDKVPDESARNRRLQALDRPIDEMFEQLKARLMAIPTDTQRRARVREGSPATSVGVQPKPAESGR